AGSAVLYGSRDTPVSLRMNARQECLAYRMGARQECLAYQNARDSGLADRNTWMGALERGLIEHASRLGFARCGIAAPTPTDGFDRLRDWLDRGFAGEMDYLGGDHTDLRRHPCSIFPNVRSVVMAAMSYAPSAPESAAAEGFTGRIARYAQ